MSDRPEWFSAKRFGYGSAIPCSWQGWLIVLAYFSIGIGSALALARKPVILLSILIPLTIIFLIVSALTTKGGWRWRRGEKE